MIESGEITTKLSAFYIRNNRSTGQKSLRCFPSCGNRGHTNRSFCGAPIQARLKINIGSFGTDLFVQSHQFLAQIRPLSEAGLSSLTVVTTVDIQSRLRNKATKHTSGDTAYYLGNVTKFTANSPLESAEVELDFNSSLCSYDYSWKSNRWKKAQETHVVDIVLVQIIEGDRMKICSSYSSDGFVIKCSKKPSEAINESNNIAPVVVQASSENPQQLTTIPISCNTETNFMTVTASKYRFDRERYSDEAIVLQSYCTNVPGTNNWSSNFHLNNSSGNELIFPPRNN